MSINDKIWEAWKGKKKSAVAFNTCKTSNIFPNKDKIPIGLSCNVVYKFLLNIANDVNLNMRHIHEINFVFYNFLNSPRPCF